MVKPDCLSWDYWLKIMAVAPDAAEWLGQEDQPWEQYRSNPNAPYSQPYTDLMSMFSWSHTPQGYNYWATVYAKVHERHIYMALERVDDD